jgi:hypothetical protein
MDEPRSHDPLDELGALACRDVDELKAARLGDQARKAFVRAHARRADGSAGLRATYRRFVEPTLVSAFCATYLAWACLRVLALHP